MTDKRRNSLKTALRCMCQIQCLVGFIVGLTGVYLLLKYRQSSLFFSQTSYMALPVCFTFATAVFLLVSGFLGSWVSTRDSACLQGLFVYLLVVVFCLGCTASALAYHHTVELDLELKPLSEVFKSYTGSSQDRHSRAVDTVQESALTSPSCLKMMQCCGIHDYRDWWDTSWFNQTGGHMLPHSCCNRTFTSCNGTVFLPQEFYQLGCHEKLQIVFMFLMSIVMWMFAVVFLVLVFLLAIIVLLMREPLFQQYQSIEKS